MYGGYQKISDERTLISEVLKQEGYATAGFHSNLFLCSDFGYQRGFDTFYDSKTDPGVLSKLRQYIKTSLNQDGFLYNLLQKIYDTTEKRAGVNVGSSYVTADKITDKSLEWVRAVSDSDPPRFLWTHYMDVHHPYVPPEEYQLEFRDTPISDRRSIKLRRKMLESPDEVTEDELDDIIDLYDAEIRFTDHQIGHLVNEVRDTWGEDTVLLITADHGEEFREHGQFSHNTVHDEGIHIPLILDDGRDSGVHNEMVGLIDISPTIVDYAGCNIPDKFYGYSLKSLVENGDWERDHVIGDWAGSQGRPDRIFYRDPDWKYMKGGETERLYDLSDNPEEKDNIINEEPPVLDEIRSRVEEHERLIMENSGVVEDAEMDHVVQDRLEQLGYKV
jgi:arylsulfatase A-like enzyme